MTMPPEANGEQGAAHEPVPPQYNPQQAPPQAPPTGAQPPPQQPAPGFQQPAPGYQQPPPGYQQPPPGYQQPPPGYQQPPPGYQQPPPGYQQPGPQPGAPADPANTIMLNYWLSVFFAWIPALIFWVMEKDKGDQRANEFHTANLNFSLIRTGVGVVTAIIAFIPFVGWVIAPLLGLASLALFVFHLMAALSAADNYRKGGTPQFLFNFPIIK